MSEVIRYLASYTPYEGIDLNGQCARHDGDYFVTADDFDRVTAERDALQRRLTAAGEREGLLRKAPRGVPGFAEWEQKSVAALKQAEGGGDE